MTTQHQITLPEPDFHDERKAVAYTADTVRRLIAEAIEAYKAKLLEGVEKPFTYLWECEGTGLFRPGTKELSSNCGPASGWNVTPLHTADQLAAAVAKEREEEQKYWMPIAMKRTERIVELEAEIERLHKVIVIKDNAVEDAHKQAELRGKRVALTHEQAKALAAKYGIDPLNLIFQTEAAHGIGGAL